MHSFIRRSVIAENAMCNDTEYICKCGDWFSSYDALEDHVSSHAWNGNGADHWYWAKCVGPNCQIVHV